MVRSECFISWSVVSGLFCSEGFISWSVVKASFCGL